MTFKIPNLLHLSKMQAELDNTIVSTQGIDYDTSSLKIIAFKTEFGELLNEHKFFKFWKVEKNRVPNTFETFKVENPLNPGTYIYSSRNPLLGEYADGIFFLLSIGNECKYSKYMHAIDAMEDVGHDIEKLCHDIFNNPLYSAGKWLECFHNYLTLGHRIGFTSDQIEKAYHKKYFENLKRQAEGY